MPLDVLKHVKNIFQDLSEDCLLEKCLHGKTQNRNESFNSIIWSRIPKHIYVGFTQFQVGLYDAVAHFNIGRKASVLVYEKLGIIPGHFTIEGCHNMNKRRLLAASNQSYVNVKKRRKLLRGKRKKRDDKNIEKEGSTYGYG